MSDRKERWDFAFYATLSKELADLALYIARVFKALYYPFNQILKYARLTVPVRGFAVQRHESPGLRGRGDVGTRTSNGKLDTFHRS